MKLYLVKNKVDGNCWTECHCDNGAGNWAHWANKQHDDLKLFNESKFQLVTGDSFWKMIRRDMMFYFQAVMAHFLTPGHTYHFRYVEPFSDFMVKDLNRIFNPIAQILHMPGGMYSNWTQYMPLNKHEAAIHIWLLDNIEVEEIDLSTGKISIVDHMPCTPKRIQSAFKKYKITGQLP